MAKERLSKMQKVILECLSQSITGEARYSTLLREVEAILGKKKNLSILFSQSVKNLAEKALIDLERHGGKTEKVFLSEQGREKVVKDRVKDNDEKNRTHFKEEISSTQNKKDFKDKEHEKMNTYRFRTKLWSTEHKTERDITVEASDITEALRRWEKAAFEQDTVVSLEVVFGAVIRIAKGK